MSDFHNFTHSVLHLMHNFRISTKNCIFWKFLKFRFLDQFFLYPRGRQKFQFFDPHLKIFFCLKMIRNETINKMHPNATKNSSLEWLYHGFLTRQSCDIMAIFSYRKIPYYAIPYFSDSYSTKYWNGHRETYFLLF